MLGKLTSAVLGILASLAFLPMVLHIPGIWRAYSFFGDHYMIIAFGLVVTWILVTVWVVVRTEQRPYWLIAFGTPATALALIYLQFWAACAFFEGCI
jgi:hypothetical protein